MQIKPPHASMMPPDYGEAPGRADEDFTRAAAWLRSPGPGAPIALVLGAPFSALSLSGARCDLLPSAIRQAMWRLSTFGHGVDLKGFNVTDLGDVKVTSDPQTSLDEIGRVAHEVDRSIPLLILGGDNSITAPAMLGRIGPGGGLVTLDAHHDLRNYQRDGLSNGSPVRVLNDSGVAGDRIWQLGISSFANSKPYSDHAEEIGVNVVGIDAVKRDGLGSHLTKALDDLAPTDGVYVDVDVDVVERALAPGAPAALPGGLAPSDLIHAAFMCGSHPNVQALDIVEVDPTRDVQDSTVRLAAMIALSFLAGVATRQGR